jgi:hypothetical protein
MHLFPLLIIAIEMSWFIGLPPDFMALQQLFLFDGIFYVSNI